MKIMLEIHSDMVDWIDNQILEKGLDEDCADRKAPYLRGQIIESLIVSARESSRKDFRGSRN